MKMRTTPASPKRFLVRQDLVRLIGDENNRMKVEAHGVSTDEYEQAFLMRHVAEQKIVALERRKVAVARLKPGES